MTDTKSEPLTHLNLDCDFMGFTAAGSGDRLFVKASEILAFEINSETQRVSVVMKNGSVVQVNDTMHEIAGIAATSRW
ncbi:hypothetical protein UFOVP345_11 [uncultured Caudovirales phage]|uniref:Uncharacterized protein n=1 Tax=uncultured Caudovirales phage TaxID=2100421 RepID=A0A6J5LY15_9CAUD|nr:hypothetical protein UFOVP345_11 [uncultured Caudovirales phage]CAB4160884.1 hypothetical protein UFOVP732_20 [uncultured Caudovirales phage]